MKCLSIRQPWAWLICTGKKPVENRTWSTQHRGTLFIHASSRFDWFFFDFVDIEDPDDPLRGAGLEVARHFRITKAGITGAKDEFGAIVGRVELADVIPADGKPVSDWCADGGFWWLLSAAKAIPPVPCKGKLNLWDLPGDIFAG